MLTLLPFHHFLLPASLYSRVVRSRASIASLFMHSCSLVLVNRVFQGTPVNEVTLAKWKADRKAKKLLEERRKVF